MASFLITLFVLVIVFCLLYWLIQILPLPAPLAGVKWVMFAILIVVAIIVLLSFIPGFGFHLGG
jgi:hypothetical protein